MPLIYLTLIDDPEEKLVFEDIYNRYREKMFSLAYRITGNYHDAEEAVSQAFFSIAKNFGKIKARTSEERSAYISIVTKNASLSVVKSRKRSGELILDDEDAPEIEDEDTDVSDEVLSGYGYSSVVAAIRALPEMYAQTLYMFNVTGLSIKEISVSVGETENTVKKRLQRAREKLRVILREQGVNV